MNAFRRALIAAPLFFVLGIQHGRAELSESQVKAAYVYNFIKFAAWPNALPNDGSVTLCVLGGDVLGGALSGLDGASANGRVLHVVQRVGVPDRELRSCRVLFIGSSERARFVSIIKSLGDAPVLTVSDIDDFAERGGCIGLRYRDNRIVFEINLAAVRKAGLRLPGQLLNLASYVFGR